jgi:hypothetical protein
VCAEDPMEALERSLREYVALRHRRGESSYSFDEALKGHRRQVLENLRDDGDESWLVRNSQLEKLAEKRGIQMYGEPEVKDVIEYRRRQAEDRRQSGQAELV